MISVFNARCPRCPRNRRRYVAPEPQARPERAKGRQVDAQALAEVRALLGDAPRRRDLLIEFLHRIRTLTVVSRRRTSSRSRRKCGWR